MAIRRRGRGRSVITRANRAEQLFGAKCKRLYRLLIHSFVADQCVNDSWQRPVKTLSRRRFVKKHAVTKRRWPTGSRLIDGRKFVLSYRIAPNSFRRLYRAELRCDLRVDIEETIYEATPAERVTFEITSYPINKCHSLFSFSPDLSLVICVQCYQLKLRFNLNSKEEF